MISPLVDAVPGKSLVRVTLHEGPQAHRAPDVRRGRLPGGGDWCAQISAPLTLGEQRPGSIRALLTSKEIGRTVQSGRACERSERMERSD